MKMMKRYSVVLLCICTIGCNAKLVETTLDGVNVSIEEPTGPVNVVDDTAQIQTAAGKYDLSVESGKLVVNGKNYGSVAEGDDVLISSDGITINGKPAHAAKN